MGLKILGWIILGIGGLAALWGLVELVMRLMPYPTDFYGSISRADAQQRQAEIGLKLAGGQNWAHLGWIADPENEIYRIERHSETGWEKTAECEFGSFLCRESGAYRVVSVNKKTSAEKLIGEQDVLIRKTPLIKYRPQISGEWKKLFLPSKSGSYLNDHTLYQDNKGDWRLIGITSKTNGDYGQEKSFAVGCSPDFPPAAEMREQDSIADFGELAWAPDVIEHEGKWYLFWSPHKLHHMVSEDGITWREHAVILEKPYHRFFRDPMLYQVGESQWLLYTTARGKYFSRVDIYQSFNLKEWQYIRPALRNSRGSWYNSAFASTESPFLVPYQGAFYLSVTYNNGPTFISGLLLLLKRWPKAESYNDTYVFCADNPYDFGVFRGKEHSESLLTRLAAHAPEWVENPVSGEWYLTSAGWPWAATITSGEAAYAPLSWEKINQENTLTS